MSMVKLPLYEILDEAFAACKIPAQKVGADDLMKAKKALRRMLNSLPARSTPLWARDYQLISLPVGQAAVPLPEGTIDVVDVNYRIYPIFASAVSEAPMDRIIDMGAVGTVHALALLFAAPVSYDITVLASINGTDWWSVKPLGMRSYGVEAPTWVAFDPSVDARYIRLSGLPAGVAGTFALGGSPSDTPFIRIDHHQYNATPNPGQRGKPLQFWLDRQATPVMRVWPTNDYPYRFHVLSLMRQREIKELGEMTDAVEIPQRWEKAMILALAADIAMGSSKVDPGILAMLKPYGDEFLALVAADERDATPIRFRANIRGYTR